MSRGGDPGASVLSVVTLGEVAAHFGAALRAGGLAVSPEREARFALAVELVRPLSLAELAAVGRLTLVTDRAQLQLFNQLFDGVFRGLLDPAESRGQAGELLPTESSQRQAESRGSASGRPSGARPGEEEGESGGDRLLGLASSEERLAHQDFAECSEGELDRLAELAAQLPLAVPTRRSRRRRRHSRGGRVDLRSTLAGARRTGAEPVRLVRSARRPRPRRLVMIADVSGSMEPYTRIYLHLFHAAVRAARAEAFVFATRLTRLTSELAERDPDLALRRAGAAAEDWAGGTRIGEAVAEFNDRWGRRGLARGAVVVVVSDGWEGANPARLGEEMGRLSRMAHRIVWVNPRSASPTFRPETAGMAAALPHVDQLVSGHSLVALHRLLEAIRAEG